MGYGIRQTGSNFHITCANKDRALAAIHMLQGKETIRDSGGAHFSWVDPNFASAVSFIEAMHCWRWSVSEDKLSADIDKIRFEGENYGDDEILFNAIAPFVETGSFIEMRGEDGTLWRYVFDGVTIKKISPKVEW